MRPSFTVGISDLVPRGRVMPSSHTPNNLHPASFLHRKMPPHTPSCSAPKPSVTSMPSFRHPGNSRVRASIAFALVHEPPPRFTLHRGPFKSDKSQSIPPARGLSVLAPRSLRPLAPLPQLSAAAAARAALAGTHASGAGSALRPPPGTPPDRPARRPPS